MSHSLAYIKWKLEFQYIVWGSLFSLKWVKVCFYKVLVFIIIKVLLGSS